MVNLIIAPTDFSDCAGYAVSAAVDIAAKASADLHLYHNVNVHKGWFDMPPAEQAMYPESQETAEAAKRLMQDYLSRFRDGGVKMSFSLGGGTLLEDMTHMIEDRDAGLVVMGSHGKSENTWFLGSNAQKLIRNAECPVMVIKEALDLSQVDHVVFASNFNLEAQPAFERVLELCRLFGATVHLLKVKAPSFFHAPDVVTQLSMQEFSRMAGDVPCEMHEIRDSSVEAGIAHFIEDIQADILTIGTYGRSPLSRMAMSSITEAVVNKLSIPVLTINIGS